MLSQMASCFVRGGGGDGAQCGTNGCTGFLLDQHPALGAPPADVQVCFNCGSEAGCDFAVSARACSCAYDGVSTIHTYQLNKPLGGSGTRR